MLPSANDIQSFLEVSQTLNLSRAAERLGISQPALSLSIKRLEENFGLPLLLRSKSGVQLTKAGTSLSLKGRELVQQWEKLKNEALSSYDEVIGQYSLGCHPSVGLYALPLCIPQLMDKYPQLNLSLKHDLSRNIAEEVISFKLDFGLVINPVEHPDLVIKPICKDVVGLWKRKGEGKPAKNLPLLYSSSLIQSQSILSELSKSGFKFERSIQTENLEVIRELTKKGVGYGILPERVASYENQLLEKIEGTPIYKDTLSLIYRYDAHKSPSSKKLIAEIADLLATI